MNVITYDWKRGDEVVIASNWTPKEIVAVRPKAEESKGYISHAFVWGKVHLPISSGFVVENIVVSKRPKWWQMRRWYMLWRHWLRLSHNQPFLKVSDNLTVIQRLGLRD